ncbi:MAG: glycyl radical protein [Planctomycetia bacterium]|nr:glycyl radical protein [Planctomycetia bacterium]
MNERTSRLRAASLAAEPTLSAERADIVTDFYRRKNGMYSVPLTRALCFLEICEKKKIWIGEDELIVGERGPTPKCVPTFPELTCHSVEDLRILSDRRKTWYRTTPGMIELYEKKIIPYWRNRTMRDRIFSQLEPEWIACYDAGIFTEFMEQRAPGHTVADGKIYRKGLRQFQRDIDETIAGIDWENDPDSYGKREQLRAMRIACDALILLANRHADLAESMAITETDPVRKAELRKIADVCRRVPAEKPRDLHEAIQMYWFCHLAVITELNGWDSFSPGHIDQHLWPFYRDGIEKGTLTRESARELIECFFIKFNNHPAPPKIGVTAEESGTYTDFANLNLAGLTPQGDDGANELTFLILDIIEEMHLLQPSSNLQLSRKTADRVLKRTLRVLRNGFGFPSIFNADAVVAEQLRQGKTIEDAREGGCSGCVETGAFGKEAYILTGYFNMVKILEITLHNGIDPRTGVQIGPETGTPERFTTFDELYEAFSRQMAYFLDVKMRGNRLIEQMYASLMPAPFLSVITDDCIRKGMDYNGGGARYNNRYVQFVGIGSLTDSLTAIRKLVYTDRSMSMTEMVHALDVNFVGYEPLRQRLLHKVPKYGNDDDEADQLMRRSFRLCLELLDGRPDTKGGTYRVEMLPTTCHVYFGSVTGATPDGRLADAPLSEGISPVQGADRHGPTAVIRSAAKMDHLRTGGTLLNMKFSPSLVSDADGLNQWANLVRCYFLMDGHHLQFNVVSADVLRAAQREPGKYRDLIVRVAGYSDYFCDLSEALQNEIIQRTEHVGFDSGEPVRMST